MMWHPDTWWWLWRRGLFPAAVELSRTMGNGPPQGEVQSGCGRGRPGEDAERMRETSDLLRGHSGGARVPISPEARD